MSAFWGSLVHAYAFLAVVPVIPFLVVYWIVKARGGDRKKAIRAAIDVTNAFLIGCVAMLLNRRLSTDFGLYFIILLLLIGGGLIGNAQNRIRGKVDTGKLVRGVWRLTFFLMGIMYLLLMSLEIILPPDVKS
ncbi:hypothetical protein SD71_18570 [Cohnella kolymensis]|uniref:DUF3397 domain-containing protein n=1 Tax=Cohnella kolymensis TaxID=1590652 RepID=A0ABR5A0Q2_9BACL|nr:DUF3397 domain-containing protein [Cohnella kolymensis]KIL34637.1 hypothetical protein SD71_18570 [Cohnella kolymensis]